LLAAEFQSKMRDDYYRDRRSRSPRRDYGSNYHPMRTGDGKPNYRAIAKMTSLKITNVSPRVRSEDVADRFSCYGEIGDIFIPPAYNGQHRGFLFVRFRKEHHAYRALDKEDGRTLKGERMAITIAKPRRPDSENADYYSGGRRPEIYSSRRRSRTPQRRRRSPTPKKRRSRSSSRASSEVSRSVSRDEKSRSVSKKRMNRRDRSRSSSRSEGSNRSKSRKRSKSIESARSSRSRSVSKEKLNNLSPKENHRENSQKSSHHSEAKKSSDDEIQIEASLGKKLKNSDGEMNGNGNTNHKEHVVKEVVEGV